MTAMQQAVEWGKTLEAGDWLTYEQSTELGDMARDELVRRLGARGLRMSTEDTDGIEIVAIETE